MSTDAQIAEILRAYGEPLAGNIWRVQGTAVIYHKALERIAAQAGITFDVPTILRAERDEAVMMVVGRMPARGERPAMTEWSIGEALIGTNYRVSGKQAAYPFAMSEKRAKDRVILKLIGLSGFLYSEDEADDFKPTKATRQQTRRDAGETLSQDDADEAPQPEQTSEPVEDADAAASRYIAECYSRISSAASPGNLIRWWNSDERKQACKDFDLHPEEIAEIKERLMARVGAVTPKTEAAE